MRNLSDKCTDFEIRQAIKSFGNYYFAQFTIPKNTNLFRARLEENRWFPIIEADLSINPIEGNILIQRANPKGYPVFYCCSDPLDNYPERLIETTAIQECSKLAKRNSTIIQFEYGYVSKWKVREPLKMAAFINHNFGNKTNKGVLIYNYEFNKMIYNKFKNHKDSWEKNCFISEQFAKVYKEDDPNKYKITSIYSQILMEGKFDGVIYPSVIRDGEGINIALSKKAMKKLNLLDFKKVFTKLEGGVLNVEVIDELLTLNKII